ncbi:MAG TPA: hypothetical protein VFH73_23490, partial [Polyangia bacterium]|nr:hypothetical protein [Polyangia bacterium]
MRSFLVAVAVVSAVAACSGGSAKPDGSPTDGQVLDGRRDSGAASDAADRAGNAGGDAAMGGSGGDAPVAPSDAVDGVTPGTDTIGRSDGSDVAPTAGRTVGEIYCPAGAPAADPLPADRQATLVPIAPPGGISFLEGPVWIADRGVLLFSEWNAGHRILQLTPPQTVEVFMPATGSNGLALTPDGKSFLMVTEVPAAGVSRVSLADK